METNNYPGEQKNNFGKSRKAPFAIIGLLALLIIIILVVIYFIYPKFSPVQYRAEFMDAVIVPQKDGSKKVWVVMDPSNKVPIKQKTASDYSNTIGYDCENCQTITYIYDPPTGKVLEKIKTDLTAAITRLTLIYNNGKVWLISPEIYDAPNRIEAYDAETSKMILDTKGFTDKFPVLSGGIASFKYSESDRTIMIRTKDNRDKIIFSFDTEKLYNTPAEFNADRSAVNEKTVSVILSPESYTEADKMMLVKINGTKSFIGSSLVVLQHSDVNDLIKLASDSVKVEKLNGKVYTEGIILHKDDDCVLILHKEQPGMDSKRIFTCTDAKTGNEKWTVTQDKLLEILKTVPSKSLSNGMLYTPGLVKAQHSGNVVIYSIKNLGIVDFDYETGKSNWSLAF